MSLYNTKEISISQIGFWKKPGETLAVMLRRFRSEYGISESEKITYAGRLDPMAEGLVPLLVGDARFQKERLLHAMKTYEVDIVLGLSTDTGDMLGLLTNKNISARPGLAEIEKSLVALPILKELPYPQYSSRPVGGRPLFMYARAGKKVSLPIKKIKIGSLELLKIREESLVSFLNREQKIIAMVQGDFRQQEILKQWQKLSNADGNNQIQIVTIRTTVSSGTYMRSLAGKMGELLGVPALASRIVRTAVHPVVQSLDEKK